MLVSILAIGGVCTFYTSIVSVGLSADKRFKNIHLE